jgi:hypothetical protein
MNTFAEILSRQNEGHTPGANSTINQILKFVFVECVANGGRKFDVLARNFVRNGFLCQENVESVVEVMGRAQRAYHTLLRFADRFISRKARAYDCDTDLAMRPLAEIPPRLRITLVENRTIYRFRLGDLITIVEKRLCNADNFFPDPLAIVNPYTNLPFGLRSLYKIYSRCKSSNYTLPPLFHQFFLCGFDLDLFIDFNECMLKEHIIDEFAAHATPREKRRKVAAMIYHYRSYLSCISYSREDHDVLHSRASHLLIHYLRSQFSLNPNVKFKSQRTVKRGLRRIRADWITTRHPLEGCYAASQDDPDAPGPFRFGPLHDVDEGVGGVVYDDDDEYDEYDEYD